MITVILNCYKRLNYLQQQIDAIKQQTIAPADIWIWYNKPEDGVQYDLNAFGCKVVMCNHNFKFHGRFALGLLAQTEYVAFFDDDTIPGKRWFENCINTINNGHDGILGSTGVLLNRELYSGNTKYGWTSNHNNDVVEVDLVGHSWFMKKKHLKYMWYEDPVSWDNGEDMQLSYLAQKYGNVNTYVPPHPNSNLELWGSLPNLGLQYGNDENASWRKKTHNTLRDDIVKEQIKRGWKLVKYKNG